MSMIGCTSSRASSLAGRSSFQENRGSPEINSQEARHALALRVRGVPGTWYLLASSFNLRKALGPGAGYSAALNLKVFVRRLAEHCPEAQRDHYFEAAFLGGCGRRQGGLRGQPRGHVRAGRRPTWTSPARFTEGQDLGHELATTRT
jgi:hypothetical protein